MEDNSTFTSDVIETLNEKVTDIETSESDLAGGVRAVVPESEIGSMFGVLRRQGYEFDSKRGPTSDTLIVNIAATTVSDEPEAEPEAEAEQESDEERTSLGELFR